MCVFCYDIFVAPVFFIYSLNSEQNRGEEWSHDHLMTKLEVMIAGEKQIFEILHLCDTPGIATAASVRCYSNLYSF